MRVKNHTSFKKGQSGNPSGRPPAAWTMKGLIIESLEEADETGEPYKKLIARKLRTLALKGDMIAIKEVNNRLDGMPQQDVTSGGEAIGSVMVYKPEKNKE